MQRVSNVDGSFLISETPTAHMHVIGVIVLAATEQPAAERFAPLERLIAKKLPCLPAFRRRVVETPLGVSQPVWVEDPEFDLEKHVKRAALPSPGGLAELTTFVAEFASRPLERNKPLWELIGLEGLEGGEIAIVIKLHHAIMDGGAGMEFLAQILDLSAEGGAEGGAEEAIVDDWKPEPLPSLSDLALHAIREELDRPRRVLTAAGEIARDVLGAYWKSGGDDSRGPGLFDAPRTSFNQSLTARRSVAFARCRLDDIKAIREHFEVKINDVVLAGCTTTLRRYLLELGELPEAPLVASVPITLRGNADADEANQVSMMLVPLPVAIVDPIERLRAIHSATQQGKRDHERVGGNVVQHFTDVALAVSTPGALGGLTQLLSASHLADRSAPMWNVVISNMAGVPVPLYCEGAAVQAIYPLGPIVDGVGLNFTLVSHANQIDLGVMACRDLVHDPQPLADGFLEAIDELSASLA